MLCIEKRTVASQWVSTLTAFLFLLLSLFPPLAPLLPSFLLFLPQIPRNKHL